MVKIGSDGIEGLPITSNCTMDQELYAELLVGTVQPVNAAAYAFT